MRFSASSKSLGGVFCVFLIKPCSSSMCPCVIEKITRPIFPSVKSLRTSQSPFPRVLRYCIPKGPTKLDHLNVSTDEFPVLRGQLQDPLPDRLATVRCFIEECLHLFRPVNQSLTVPFLALLGNRKANMVGHVKPTYSNPLGSSPVSADRFSNRVYRFKNANFIRPVGPLRCFARISSAMPFKLSLSGR